MSIESWEKERNVGKVGKIFKKFTPGNMTIFKKKINWTEDYFQVKDKQRKTFYNTGKFHYLTKTFHSNCNGVLFLFSMLSTRSLMTKSRRQSRQKRRKQPVPSTKRKRRNWLKSLQQKRRQDCSNWRPLLSDELKWKSWTLQKQKQRPNSDCKRKKNQIIW